MQTGKRGIRLTAERITTTFVPAQFGAQFAGQSLLFVPRVVSQLPEGLIIQEELVTVSQEKSAYIPVSVANTSKLDVSLTSCNVLGHLEEIKAVYPITVDLIPRIQDMLDSLHGSSWFSFLGQGKAYH